MTLMRAKLSVGFVQDHFDWQNKSKKTMQTLTMHAVPAPKYDADGLDEDNTFAKFSPGAQLSINIANPALFDQFTVGDRFYVDFTRADVVALADKT